MTAPDHFSAVAGEYARYRPGYPAALLDRVAAAAPGRQRLWDCGAGSGQASRALAERFAEVVATDLSTPQLRGLGSEPRVWPVTAIAEAAPLVDGCVDAVVAAQALHWFDRRGFYAELERVLVPGGLFAAWSYGPPRLAETRADAALQRFYAGTVGPYWPPERRHVDDGYASITWPWPMTRLEGWALEARWPLAGLLGYIGSWSATARYRAATGEDPAAALAEALEPHWGEGAQRVRWPLAVFLGHKPSS